MRKQPGRPLQDRFPRARRKMAAKYSIWRSPMTLDMTIVDDIIKRALKEDMPMGDITYGMHRRPR